MEKNDQVMKEIIYSLYERVIELCDYVDKASTRLGMQNTQEFINYQDKLNKYSLLK